MDHMEVDDQNNPNFYSLFSRLFIYTLSTSMHSSSNHGRCHIRGYFLRNYLMWGGVKRTKLRCGFVQT